MIHLIGIHGPLNGGKDTTADYIQSRYKDQFSRYAFAAPIKRACEVMFGFTKAQLEDRVLKEQIDEFWGFSPRNAMQLLGTEYGRDMLRADVWIKRAELEHKQNAVKGFSTIITDVRFENEAEWLRSQPNAKLIYLRVPGLEKDEKYNHASENGIKFVEGFDKLVINDKSLGLGNLYQQLNEIF